MKPTTLLLLMLLPFLSMCQPLTIKGKVINENNEPVIAATVSINRTKQSTTTDNNGIFTIHYSPLTTSDSRPNQYDSLLISAVGYELKRLPIDHSQFTTHEPLTITLIKKSTTLSEVTLSTGYQDIPKERATGAFAKIDNQWLNRQFSPDILGRLENTSQVYFDRRNGGSDISIRGRSTLFANTKPLIILDDAPYEGDINNINPNDVESITLLKDAAAASIWGAFAGNGVIIITTKKGKTNQPPRLELTANFTRTAKPDLFYDPAFIPSAEYISLEKFLFEKGYYNTDLANTINFPVISPVVDLLHKRKNNLISPADSAMLLAQWGSIDSRHQLRDYLYRNSFNRQLAINYSGGSAKNFYQFSVGYDNNSADRVRNSNNRISLRAANTYKPSDKWDFSFRFTYTMAENKNNNTGSTLAQPSGKSIYPYLQLKDQQGNHLTIPRNYRQSFIDTAGNGKLLDWNYRPLDELEAADNKSSLSDALFNIGITFKPVKAFSVLLKYQYEKQTTLAEDLNSRQTYLARDQINMFTIINGSQLRYQLPLGAILDRSQAELNAHYARAQANFNKNVADHHSIVAIAGVELRENQVASSSYRIYGYDPELLTTISAINFADLLPTYNNIGSTRRISNLQNNNERVNRFVSLFSNASYTYKERYILSASIRKDASNLFGVHTNQKGVPLWSAGAAWELSKESFYKTSWLPYLKARITYGCNGNIDNSLTALPTLLYFAFPSLVNNQVYANINNPPNPALRWERIYNFNIGLDFSFNKDRITGSLDYYRKNGKDLIGETAIDPTTGIVNGQGAFTYKGNVANMKGQGIELDINTHNLTGIIKWDTRFQFNFAANKITRYNYRNTINSFYVNNGNFIAAVPGKPVLSVFSYATAGLDPATGDPRGYDENKQVSKNYSALTNTSLEDLIYHGPVLPKFFGFLVNTFSWKQLSVSCNLSYKMGYYFRRSSIDYGSLFAQWRGHKDYLMRWQQPGDEQLTAVPSLVYPNNSSRDVFFAGTETLVEKGDHIRLQDITFTWNGNPRKKGWFKECRFNINANNLGIIWRANNVKLDPDYPTGGFPLPLTISMGIKTIF